MLNALDKAIAHFETQGKLADAIGVKQQTVSLWRRKLQGDPDLAPFSAEHAVAIENATNRAVRREELRPDLWASVQ